MTRNRDRQMSCVLSLTRCRPLNKPNFVSRIVMAVSCLTLSLIGVVAVSIATSTVASAGTTIPAPGASWDFNGSASLSSGSVELTPASTYQAGSAWYTTPISVPSSLTVSFEMNMSGGSGADGVTVDLLNAADGGPTSVGTDGGGIGFGGLTGVGVSFDTYNDGCGDPSANFVGVIDGSTCGGSVLDYHLGTNASIATLHGETHLVTVTFNNGASPSVEAWMDNIEVLNEPVASLPSSAYFGFTSATGAATDVHTVSDFSQGPIGGVVTGTQRSGGGGGISPGTCDCKAGEPVDVATGDYFETDTDASVATYGPALNFTRTYDAVLAQEESASSAPGPLGYGWTDNMAMSLALNTDYDTSVTGDVTLNQSNGSQALFVPPVSGACAYPYFGPGTSNTYCALPQVLGSLTYNSGSSTYTLVEHPRTTYTFNSSGQLTSITDPNGDSETVTYNSPSPGTGDCPSGAGSCETVTAASGRTITLGWSGSGDTGTITSATDNLGRETTYTYSGGSLTSVTDPLSEVTSYTYDSSNANVDLRHDLLTVVDPNEQSGGPDAGDDFANTYNSSGQVTSQSDSMGNVTSFDYSGMNASTLTGTVVETDPDSNETQYTFNDGSLTQMVTAYGTASAATTTYQVDPSTLLNDAVTDANGNATEYTYDGDGNVLTSTNALSHVTSYSYNAFDEVTCEALPEASSPCSSLTPPSAIAPGGTITPPASAPPDQVTYSEYDTSGNLLYTTTGDYPPSGGSASQSRTTYKLYNGESVTLNSMTDSCATSAPTTELPCATINADDVVTQLGYDAYGDLSSKSTPFENNASVPGTMFTYVGGPSGPLPATTVFQGAIQLASATVGGTKYVYAADPHNSVVRSINDATDSESVVAGNYAEGDFGNGSAATNAQLSNAQGIAVDSAGDMAIADTSSNTVRFVPALSGTYFGLTMTAGDIYSVAGTGTAGLSGNGSVATSAKLDAPTSVAFDSSGIVVADTANNEVRFIPNTSGTYFGQSMTAGYIYAVAGTGTAGLSGNGGAATSAKLDAPNGLAVDSSGDVAIADHTNNEVRFVPVVTGTYFGQSMTADDIYAVAGTGTSGYSGNGAAATSAKLNSASGVAFDSSGDLVIADTNNHVVRLVPKTSGTYYGQSMTADDIYAVAGNGTSGMSGNGGAGTSAELGTPVGVAVDLAADIYVSDLANDQIRVLAGTSGTLVGTTVTADDIYLAGGNSAGSASESSYSGAAYNAELNVPSSVRTDAAGDVIVADTADNAIRVVPENSGTFYGQTMTGGNIYTVAGNGTAGSTGNSGPATSAELSAPQGVAVSSTGNLAIADTANNEVRFVPASSGTYFGQSMTADDIYIIAGNGTLGYSGNGAAATSAELDSPDGVSFDSSGDLVIADASNHVIRFVPVSSGTYYGQSMTADDIYTIVGNHTSGYSGNGGAATSAEISSPNDVTVDAAGDLFIPDTGNNVVRFVPVTSGTYYGQSMTADDIYTIAGNGTSGYSGNGGAATSAEFNTVTDAAVDAAGDVFITDAGNDYLRYLPKTTGEYSGQLMTANHIYTIAGEGVSSVHFAGDHGPPLNAEFGWLSSVAYDGNGGFYLADSVDQRVRHNNFNSTYYLAIATYSYDADGEMTDATTPNGNLVTGANAGNHTTVYTYNADGEITVASQGSGTGYTDVPRVTDYGYDADANETSMKDPLGYTYDYTFNAGDEETLSTSPLSDATLTCYDGDGNVAETVPPTGVAANSLTPASCPASYPTDYGDRLSTDATTTTYNALNEPTVVTSPAPAGLTGYETTTDAYDAGGRLTSVNAPPTSTTGGAPNDVTEYTYDTANELLTTTTGYGTATAATTSSCYDPDGEVTATVPGDGNVSSVAACSGTSPYQTSSNYQTAYLYDSLGEVVTQTAPATTAAPSGEITDYTYDPAGNEISLVNPDGTTTSKTYTPQNLVSTETYSDGTHGVTYTYDAAGNEVGVTDASGTTTNGIDPFDEATNTTNGAGLTTTYAYNADGSVDRITYPLGAGATWASTDTLIYQYDHAGDLTESTDFKGSLSRIGYSADGLPTTLKFGPSGPTLTTVYAANDEPSTMTLSNGTTLQGFAYSDEPSGAVASETDTPTGSLSPADYVYDAQGRVTKDTPGSGSALSYTEDQGGDVTTLPAGASGTYNYASELTAGGSTSYSYDASGNRVGASGGTSVTATYNGDNELTSYDNTATADMTSATYDGNGLRTSDTTGASTQNFVWGTATPVPELLQDSTSAYIYGPFGVPFEEVNLSTGTVQFLVTDDIGSVRGVVSSSGSLTASTSYDAWGNPETAGGLSTYTPFGFAGGYTDSTGLEYFINRYYDRSTGQFVNVDPQVTETEQPYSYVGDDPVNEIDPFGLCNSGVPNAYYPGLCAKTGAQALKAEAYIQNHVSGGGFSFSAGFGSVAHVADNTATEVTSHWRGIAKVGLYTVAIAGGITCAVATVGVCSGFAGTIAVTLVGGAAEGVAEHAIDGCNQSAEGYLASAGQGSIQEVGFAIPEEFVFGGEAQHAVPAGFFRTAWNLFH